MNIAAYIDHTILKPTTLITDIEQLCTEAIENNFAAVCVPPLFVKKAKTLCANTNIKIATVVGFPFGYSAVEAKLAEILLAIVDGADELDMVINIAALKNNDWQYLAHELNHVMTVVQNKQKTIKIIIESSILTYEEIIKCCDLYGIAGVDFMVTSTGYAKKGASVHAVKLMRKHLAETIKIKANGCIRTFAFAKELIDAGADRIGSTNSMEIVAENKLQNKFGTIFE